MLKKIYLIFGIVFITNLVFSQSYTFDKESFVKEFQKALNENGKGEYQDFSKKELPLLLVEKPQFPEEYFKKMVETCNAMELKRLKAYPEIFNYVYSVYSLVKEKQSDVSYKAWHSSLDKLLENKNTQKAEDYLQFSSTFFSKKIICDNPTFDWYYIGGGYIFEFSDKPTVKFSQGNLICRVNNNDSRTKKEIKFVDSVVVNNTAGLYDPLLKKWIGEGGSMTWEKVGLPKSQTSAVIKKYEFSARSSTFSADSVVLTTPYFAKPVKGRIADRAFKVNREEDKVFPEFTSYERRLSIKKIKPEVDYEGGFSLMGANFVGIGFPKEPAKMVIHRVGSPFITVTSQEFILTDSKMSSVNSAIKIMINGDSDSILHPGVAFNYIFDRKSVELTRTKTGNGQSPFFNSYHQVDMYVQKLTWNTESTDLVMAYEMGTSQEQKIARFESKNYFDAKLFDKLQGMEPIHPLVAIYNYCYKNDEYVLFEGKVATALNKTVEQVKPLFLEFANYGFISYDTEAKMITVNQKLINFVLSKSGNKDFDNIIFTCDFRPQELKGYTEDQIKKDDNLRVIEKQIKEKNEIRRMLPEFGKMSLSSMELNLKAIDFVNISDAQKTIVFPTSNEVILKKDRNFDFVGWINSGKMELNVLASTFNYKEFKFTILKTHKSLFRVAPLSEQDGKRPIAMMSSLNGITGELFIDHPTNRSGVNPKITDYPQLKVSKPSYVYYNSQAIYRGTYDSSRFYYTVDPFFMDSLDNFNEKSFRVIGELTSAGIFPKFRENLTIMPDYSFGFSTKAPAGGYDFYGTKSKYENKILLSNNGLEGAGTINYIESSSVSKGFTFFPDSTIGLAVFTNRPVEAGVQFPDVTCEAANITYVPKKNLLKAASTNKFDLLFFNKEAKLRGTAIVKAEGMRGFGLMNFKNATMLSDDYVFSRWDIDSDTTGFSLKNQYLEDGEEPIALKTENVQGHVSFKTRIGEFKSNNGEARLDFPVNQYFCTMDKFTWFMDLESIEVEAKGGEDEVANADLDLLGPNFFSAHPDQDSLQFRAPKAAFNLKEKSIYCTKVQYIDVADARIYPDSSKVIIRKKAKMEPFQDAKVVANYITQYHKFLHCQIAITARKRYSGKGIYPYYDQDSLKTDFVMDKIYLDSTEQTVAVGKISQDAKFYLSKQFDYYGNIQVIAYLPTIIFNGSTRMNHNCAKFPRSWIALSANIDPANIQIPITADMKNIDGQNVMAGMAWRDSRVLDSIRLYSVFLSPLQNAIDPIVMSATGLLQYNLDAKEFQIGSVDKLLNRGEIGSFLSLHTETCIVSGDGQIDLGMNYGDVTVKSVGTVNYDPKKGETNFNLTSKFAMPVDKGLMEKLAVRLAVVEGLKPLDFNSSTMEQAMVEWSGREEADKMKAAYTINGDLKFPKEMESTITLTGLKLKTFDIKTMQDRGLISTSETASIVGFYGKPIFKAVPFKAFFLQTFSETSADKFGLQINIPTLDYFFDYGMELKDGTLRILSGDAEFVTALSAIKDDKKKIKNFKYQLETGTVYVSKFLRYFGL
jgi:hypothetical protein